MGSWHKALVVVVKQLRKKPQYTVENLAGSWDVDSNAIRAVPVDLRSLFLEDSMGAKNKREDEAQLWNHIHCVPPTPYEHSQHFKRRNITGISWNDFVRERENSREPNLENKLAFVGEQVLFGNNMLGTFSACDWGIPKYEDADKATKDGLKSFFCKHFSFGNSCFILEREKLTEKVAREEVASGGWLMQFRVCPDSCVTSQLPSFCAGFDRRRHHQVCYGHVPPWSIKPLRRLAGLYTGCFGCDKPGSDDKQSIGKVFQIHIPTHSRP
jgi:hypothetical protein